MLNLVQPALSENNLGSMRNCTNQVYACLASALLLVGCNSGQPSSENQQDQAKTRSLAERCEARRLEADGGRIVGGEPAKAGSAPWQVEIFSPPRYDEKDARYDRTLTDGDECKVYLDQRQDFELRHQCGGSYIGDDWVITAAHCVVDIKGFGDAEDTLMDASGREIDNPRNAIKYRNVRIGTQNLTAGGEIYDIDSVVIHGDYRNAEKLHDIALIRLKKNPATDTLVKRGRLAPVPLMKSNDRKFDEGENLRVTGWGWMGHRGATDRVTRQDSGATVQRNPAVLQQLSLRYQPDAVCSREYGSLYGPGSLCAGSLDAAKFEGSCQGDSGGPLTRQDGDGRTLVGLVSFAKGCGAGKPVVYTRVSHYDDWIVAAKQQVVPGKVVTFSLSDGR